MSKAKGYGDFKFDLYDSKPCQKLKYTSIRKARAAHSKAHFRIRVYWCDECLGYHATNQEKR